MDVHSPLFRLIARLLIGVLFLNPLLSTAAELAVDASAGGNTQITAAANGVPIVNIATPTGGGLSHNKFTDYNVGQQGLILNNATGHFNDTQLGGVILGNSNLNGRAAGLILNEITGSNPSQLKGYTEVAGQAAQVVVANPYGITCDGCGFINTPRVTLTTGTPVIADGQIKHFSVEDGQIVFDGAGMNAANISQFELITRATRLNAAIYAQRLSIITGRNVVDAETLAATPKADDGRLRPGVSIDSSALGGMYAGAIRLVGTEAGVGVRASADMAASADDVEIDINGKLTVLRAASGKDLRVKAEAVEFLDRVHADGDVQITAKDSVEIRKSLTSAANVSIAAGSLSNHGTLGGAGSVRLTTADLLNQNGLIFSGQDMVLVAERFTNRLGDVYSLGALDITASEQLDNRSGSIESAGSLSIQAKRIDNQRDELTTRQEKYAAQISELPCSAELGAGDCDSGKRNHLWQILERDRLSVTAASRSSFITAGGNLQLLGESLRNASSSISAAGDLNIQVDDLHNIGIQPGEYQTSRVFRSERTRHPEGLQREAQAFTAQYWPQSNDPLGLVAALNNFIGQTEAENEAVRSIAAINTDGETYSAIIQAGGKVAISTQNSFDSSVVRPTYAYVAGGNLATTDASGSAIATAVSHNPQRHPELHQQATLPGFSLPSGSDGLFKLNTDGTHRYLVETNPAFATLRGFISSDYLLNSIGYNKDQTQRRLGDGLYEQRLIQQAVIARTGKRFLDGLTSDEAQFRYLMDNAIASKQALHLVPGIALSAEQVAALTHDIVWMQEQEVAGQKVLVPVLYLAQVKDRLAPTGALIQGQDVALIAGKDLRNAGTLRAANDLSVNAGNISNSGLMQADKNVALLATDSIRNSRGGLIVGQDVSAIALTGDLVNERSVTTHQSAKQGFERREDFVDSAAGIEAKGNLSLAAGRDLINLGSHLTAGSDAKLSAGRDLLIASQSEADAASNRGNTGHSHREQTTQYGSTLNVGGALRADAGRDLTIVGSTVQAGGDLNLSATQDLTIASAANQSSSDSYHKGGGKKVTDQTSRVRQQGSLIESGGNLTVEAGHHLIASASQLKAANEAYLYAGDQLALLSAEDSDHSLYDKQKKGSFGAKESRKDETTTVRQIGTRIESGGDLSLISEGNQHYQKASLHSGGDLTLDSGGAITFEAVKDLDQQSHEKSKNSWVWTSTKGEGRTDETLRQSELVAKGETIIRAVDGLHIDIKQIDQHSVSQAIDAMVAADPSLVWLKEAEKRGDVDWRRVQELHDSWDYQHSGLGGPAMMVIAIIVAYLTAGAASGLIGAAASGTTAGAASGSLVAATASTSAGWANVALTSMATSAASTAAISTINNKGNLGAALKDTFSNDSLKNYLVAGLTAGLTSGLFNDWTSTQTSTGTVLANSGTVVPAGGLGTWQGAGQFAANQALQNTTSAVLNKLLGRDGSLSEALRNSLANTFAAVGFNLVGDIGDAYNLKEGGLSKVGLHALMGGLAAEAAGGDFKTGAVAAGINEVLVDRLAAQYAEMSKAERNRLLVMNAQLIGVLSTAIQSPDADNEQLQLGAWVAQNGTQYNYLSHGQLAEAAKALRQCGENTKCRQDVTAWYLRTSLEQDLEAVTQCAAFPQNCAAYSREVANAMANPDELYAALGGTSHKELDQLRNTNLEFQEMLVPVTSGHQAGALADTLQQKWGLSNATADQIRDGLVLLALGGAATAKGVAALKSAVAVRRAERAAESSDSRRELRVTEGGAKGAAGVIDTAPMAQKIADIRATLPSRLKSDGNMAVAEVSIDGLPSNMAAHSRINSPTATQKAQGLVGEGGGIFNTQSVPNQSGVSISRAGDSEAKILDNLAQRLGNNTATKGVVTIFTERPACTSCLGVVEQFKEKYPNIRVDILDNNGVIIRPPKGN